MNTLRRQHFTGKLQTGEDIIPLKVGKLGKHTFYGITPRQVFEDTLDRIPQTTNAGLTMAHCRVKRDTREQGLLRHAHIVQASGTDAKPLFYYDPLSSIPGHNRDRW